MRKFLFTFVFLSNLAGAVAALPKLPSTFAPLAQIGNAHVLGRNARIIRGASPVGFERLLKQVGFSDVLIFKNEISGENTAEYNSLVALGFAPQRITQIPFVWKDMPSPEFGCAQVVQGLQKMREVAMDRSRALFFHCTVGEDRTGLLAGAFRMVFDGWSADQAFGAEMCAHGYANANSKKAAHVARAVHQNLTPVFAKVAALVESGHLNFNNLNPALCTARVSREMLARMRELSQFACRTGSAGLVR